MRFQNLILATIEFGPIDLVTAGPITTSTSLKIRDGIDQADILEKGSIAYRSLDSSAEPTVLHFKPRNLDLERCTAFLTKRAATCFGDPLLNAATADDAVQKLNGVATFPVGYTLTSENRPRSIFVSKGDVVLIYCINAAYSEVNIDLNDVNYALYKMDQRCRPYEPSQYQW